MTTIYLATLGGTPEPVFLPISKLPSLKKLFFLATKDSHLSASEYLAKLPDNLEVQIILTENPNDLAVTYQSFRHALLKLPLLKSDPNSILCNITGGTKPMSAALMMLATEFELPMTYVGGSRRDKSGVGTVVSGHEKELPQQNPWEVLRLTEIRRIKNLWDSANFSAASEVLSKTGERLDSELWKTFSLLAEALAARLRFDFKLAHKALGKVRRDLPDFHPLQSNLHEIRKTCGILAKSTSPGAGDPQLLLGELLGSAALADSQHRYEDAAARLYRSIELWAQIHLFEETDGSYWDGKLRYHKNEDKTRGEPFSVPAALTEPNFLENIRCSTTYPKRLALTDLFLALDALQFQPVREIAADILQGRNHSKFIRMSAKRNESILAHGTVAVTEEKYHDMKNTLFRLIPDFPAGDYNSILPPPFEESWVTEF